MTCFDTFDTLDPFTCRHCGGNSFGQGQRSAFSFAVPGYFFPSQISDYIRLMGSMQRGYHFWIWLACSPVRNQLESYVDKLGWIWIYHILGWNFDFGELFELGALATFKFRFFLNPFLWKPLPYIQVPKKCYREGPYSCSLVRLLPQLEPSNGFRSTHQGIREVCWEFLYQECGAGNHDPQTGGRDHL